MRITWWVFILLLSLEGMKAARADTPDLSFVDSFKTHDPQNWEVAHYQFSHPHFDTDWVKANAVFDAPSSGSQGLSLHLAPQKTHSRTDNKFTGASIRRQTKTHFGRYEAWIKPAHGKGLVTGFFTYTGPYYGTQHDEIDIEFLGKNTHQIHIAWFTDGELTNKFIDLPFDAAKAPHLYAFEWMPHRITWFVDGVQIYSVDARSTQIPQTPSRLFANIWAADPSIAAWAGQPVTAQSGTAWFGEVSFTPAHQMINAKTLGAATMTMSTGSAAPASGE